MLEHPQIRIVEAREVEGGGGAEGCAISARQFMAVDVQALQLVSAQGPGEQDVGIAWLALSLLVPVA